MNHGHDPFAGRLSGLETELGPKASLTERCRLFWLRSQVASTGVWPRIGILFVALCLIKILLLVSLRKNLFEIHWRYSSQPYSWLNEAAFYLFAALVGLHVLVLARKCRAAGKRALRAANATVLVLSAAFILLTFHAGEMNYLALLMNDVLRWKDLGWYFAMDFCFQQPYLFVWIFGYALSYYVLARTGRETLAPGVTALCATAYIALHLYALTLYFDALLIVDVVGLASLIFARRSGSCLGLFWILMVVAATLSFFALFHGLDRRVTLSTLNPEFVILGLFCLALVGGSCWIAWRYQFWRSWSWMIPFVWLTFALFINVNYSSGKNYLNLLCTSATAPRYFLGEVAVAGALLALALAYRGVRPSGSLWWLDTVSFGIVALALADLRLSQIMGERLEWQALNLAFGETPRMIWRMTRPYLLSLTGALLFAAGVYVVMLRLSRSLMHAGKTPNRTPIFAGAGGFLVVFVLLGGVGVWRIDGDKAEGQSLVALATSSPLWQRTTDPPMDARAFQERAGALGMSGLLQPAGAPGHPARNLNVVLIFQESTYNKFLSLFNGTNETEPLLSRYKDRMELFPNFYTSFAGSMNARFASFTGLYPARDYRKFTEDRVEVQSIFEVLHDHGYDCSLFYSSFFDYTDFRDFLKNRKLDEKYDADTMPGERKTRSVSWGLREDEALGAIQAKIRDEAAKGGKFFLTYVPAAPHNPFDGTPKQFCKYKEGAMNDFTPRYLNELLYMDWIVASIVDQLKESGLLDRTLVIITGDHGEMLGANGGPIGHGWAVNPELANVPLIIMDPDRQGYRVNATVGSQVDLLPTVLDLLGIPMPAGQLCQGTSLYGPSSSLTRTIFLSSMREFGILQGSRMFCGDRDASRPRASLRAFQISNHGAQSLYTPTPPIDGPRAAIAEFDRFQENLLRHYSEYCRLLEEGSATRTAIPGAKN